MITILAVLLSTAHAAEQSADPPKLVTKIPLPDVHGRIGHLAADLYQGRLFVAASGNDSVEVINVKTNSLITEIHEVLEPQSVAYVHSSNQIFVSNGGDGTLRTFDGSTYKPIGTLRLGSDPGAIRVDETHNRVYVGYGTGAIAVLDTKGKRLADIALKSHPESFQLAENKPRLFVNLPDSHSVAVVDTSTLRTIAEWPIADEQENFPLAIDEEKRRVFVASRRPGRLLVLDMDSGLVLTRLPAVGDADDLFFDPIHARIYVAGGRGQLSVYVQETPDQYTALDSIPTVAGTRTGLFVSEWNRLFVAVRDFAAHTAEIRIYQP